MLTDAQVEAELAAYTENLMVMSDRYQAGERSALVEDLQRYGDELTCLLEEAPLSRRNAIDALIDRCEALRISSSN